MPRELTAGLDRFGGEEIDTAGDGFLALVDGPGRAIRCALAIDEAVTQLGLQVRLGLHTGEWSVRRVPRLAASRSMSRLGW
jgi:class 3 adenylate cyclase